MNIIESGDDILQEIWERQRRNRRRFDRLPAEIRAGMSPEEVQAFLSAGIPTSTDFAAEVRTAKIWHRLLDADSAQTRLAHRVAIIVLVTGFVLIALQIFAQ